MADAIRIDTLRFSKRLIAAGMDARVAEATTESIAEVLAGADTSPIATKQDLVNLKLGLVRQMWIVAAVVTVATPVALLIARLI